jgi:hypothetical protein
MVSLIRSVAIQETSLDRYGSGGKETPMKDNKKLAEQVKEEVSRRSFLTKVGNIAAGAAVLGLGAAAVFSAPGCYGDYADGYGDYGDGYSDYVNYGDYANYNDYSDGYSDYADYNDYVNYDDGYANFG